jgi:hypothetical protein
MTEAGFVRMTAAAGRFLERFGFVAEPPRVSGRELGETYSRPDVVVHVSFEPGSSYLLVVVQRRSESSLSDIDDPQASPRLSALNAQFMRHMTPEERTAVDEAFGRAVPADDEEQRLLRSLKELCLVLPHFLAQGVG